MHVVEQMSRNAMQNNAKLETVLQATTTTVKLFRCIKLAREDETQLHRQ